MQIRIPRIHFHKLRASHAGFLYIFLMVIGNLHEARLFSTYYLTAFICSGIVFLLGIYSKNKYKHLNYDSRINDDIIRFLIIPWIIFIIYNIYIYASGNGNPEFIKSSFVQICFTPIILLGAWGAITICGKNTLRYLIYSYVIYYIIALPIILYEFGINKFFAGIAAIFTGSGIDNPFERNSDIVLALGLLLIFYFDKYIKSMEKNRPWFLILLLVLLGDKRIVALAICVLFIINIIFKRISYKRSKYFQNIISGLITIALYAFIYLIKKGILSAFVYGHNINAMGRLKMWDYIAQYMDWSITFPGRGYAFSNLTLEIAKVLTWEGRTYVLHSDVLKMFVEFGPIIFGFWIIYNLYIIPRHVEKKYGSQVRNFIWSANVYLFVLYLTDNAINYFIVQTLYYVLIFNAIRYEELEGSQLKNECS